MEVAPFFVDFHHFLSIFTIFCQFSPFFIDFHDLRTFVAIYILSRSSHFFRKFFLAKIAFSATSHVFCMYVFVILQLQTKHIDEGTPKETVLKLTDTLLETFFWCFYRISPITGPFPLCTLPNFMKSNSFHFVCVFSKMIY